MCIAETARDLVPFLVTMLQTKQQQQFVHHTWRSDLLQRSLN